MLGTRPGLPYLTSFPLSCYEIVYKGREESYSNIDLIVIYLDFCTDPDPA